MQFDLCTDFVAQARADRAIEKVAHAGGDGILGEVAGGVNDAGEPIEREHAVPATDDKMQTDVEVEIFPRESDCLVARSRRNHQAGSSEDALAMRPDDTGVDLARE